MSRLDPLDWPWEHRLRAVRLAASAALIVGVCFTHPAPGLKGTGLAVLILLIAIAVAAVGTCVVVRDGRAMAGFSAVFAVAAAVLAMLEPTGPGFGLLFVAMATAGRELDGRTAASVLVLTAGASVLAAVLHGTAASAVYGYLGGMAGLLLVGRSRRHAVLRVEQSELLLAQVRRSQEEQARAAALAERTRIARDLHDVLAHSLSALAIQIEGARALVERDAPSDRVLPLLEQARESVARGLAESRRAVAALRESSAPLAELLDNLAEEHRGAGEELAFPGTEVVLDPPATMAVYRLVQEALSNVRKHARGSAVRLDLQADAGAVVVTVANRLPAAGPAPPAGSGYGLRGMRERLEAVGGTVQAGPVNGEWLVQGYLPLSGAAPDATGQDARGAAR